MPLYGTVNVRVPEETYRKIDALLSQYGSRTSVIVAAINALYASRGRKQTPTATEEASNPAPVAQVKVLSTKSVKGFYTNTEQGRAAVERIKALFAAGKGQNEIAKALNEEGFTTSNSNTWERGNVEQRLRSLGLKGNA